MPAADYILPFGKAAVALAASEDALDNGESVCVITYGMGVHWAKAAAKSFDQQVEIIDLRTLFPLDEETTLRCITAETRYGTKAWKKS